MNNKRTWICVQGLSGEFTVDKIYTTDNEGRGIHGNSGFRYSQPIYCLLGASFIEVDDKMKRAELLLKGELV